MFLSCGDWGGSGRGEIFKGHQGGLLVRDFIDHSQCLEVPHVSPTPWPVQGAESQASVPGEEIKLCIANALGITL